MKASSLAPGFIQCSGGVAAQPPNRIAPAITINNDRMMLSPYSSAPIGHSRQVLALRASAQARPFCKSTTAAARNCGDPRPPDARVERARSLVDLVPWNDPGWG